MSDKQLLPYPEHEAQQAFAIIPGVFSPTFNDSYTTLLPQNSSERSQNKSLEPPYPFAELPYWDNIKLPEKIDVIDINSKDLSPSGYYGELNVPVETIQYNSQWASNTNNVDYMVKSATYSSCAHVGKYYEDISKSTPYCSVQKAPADKEPYKSCAYYNSNVYYSGNKHIEGVQNFYPANAMPYNSKYSDLTENVVFNQHSVEFGVSLPDFPPLDHQNEASNDESDIIVEDFSSECSEEQEPHTTQCLICNAQNTSVGLQFYILTSKNPLTMSSQIPVKRKILEFIDRKVFWRKNYLCNDCLGLVNTIDHLQLKLGSLIEDLQKKLKSNNIRLKKPGRRSKLGKFKCKKCCKMLCVKTYMKNHVKRHQSGRFLCELCGKTACTFRKLQNHLKIHKKPKVSMIPVVKCSNEHCRKGFKTKFHLQEHENFCLGLLPFECKKPYCNKKFASSTKLKSHVKLKHDKKFIAICSICNIGFVKVSDYKSHMITHSTDKKFTCPKCDKSYKTLSNLNFHLRSHQKTLPYICGICKKGFMRKEYHEAHMNNHKGIKNFNCPVCDKKFVSQKNLDAHLKYHEGTVKSNTCNICKKVITSCFEEHLRVHSNLKEFECDVCDMKFNTKNSLSKHKKRKHDKEENIT